MNHKQRLFNLLGLAQKAGKIVSGEELVTKEIQLSKAQLVFIAQDAGKNTLKKIKDKSTYYQIPCCDLFSAAELTNALGKPRKVVAVMDAGFAKKMGELI